MIFTIFSKKISHEEFVLKIKQLRIIVVSRLMVFIQVSLSKGKGNRRLIYASYPRGIMLGKGAYM